MPKFSNLILKFLEDFEDVNFTSFEISNACKLNRRTVDRNLKILCRKKIIDFETIKTGVKKLPTKKYQHKK